MKENLQIVLLTIVLFVGGLMTGIWTQRLAFSPSAPPFPLLHEFGADPRFDPPFDRGNRELDYAHFRAMEPQIHAYEEKIGALREKYRDRIAAVLTEPQRKVLETSFAGMPKLHGLGSDERPPEHPPFDPPEFISMIIYRPLFDKLSVDLKFDAGQKEKINALLIERREELLKLIDSEPPPTLFQHDFARPERGEMPPSPRSLPPPAPPS